MSGGRLEWWGSTAVLPGVAGSQLLWRRCGYIRRAVVAAHLPGLASLSAITCRVRLDSTALSGSWKVFEVSAVTGVSHWVQQRGACAHHNVDMGRWGVALPTLLTVCTRTLALLPFCSG